MRPIRLAINGFGRIGRTFLRSVFYSPTFRVVAINDPFLESDNVSTLLKYDSVYGPFKNQIGEDLRVDMRTEARLYPNSELLRVGPEHFDFFHEKDLGKLPWGALGIDIVVESSGAFTTREKLQPHLDAGAKRVVLTAPTKDESIPMVTPNIGEHLLEVSDITSNASCTTNAVNPLIAVLGEQLGRIVCGSIDTVHSYTNGQGLVDGPGKKGDFRRGRAAAENIIPAETGAAYAVGVIFPELKGKFDGAAIRVPTPSGSYLILTLRSYSRTSSKEVNKILKEASQQREWEGILGVTEEQLVSRDIIGSTYGSLVDAPMTSVVDGCLVKVFSWYDNEWGYCCMLRRHIESVAKLLTEEN